MFLGSLVSVLIFSEFHVIGMITRKGKRLHAATAALVCNVVLRDCSSLGRNRAPC